MTTRADLEHLARVLLANDGILLEERSALDQADLEVLQRAMTRAERALRAVRCELVGEQCTCWTHAELIDADQALRAP